MRTPDVVSQEILAKLAITAPGFSLELGTPERKIVDAVAESISEASVDQYLTGSLLDIESKTGLELEQFCLLPGTPVVTPAEVRPIEALRPGDEVVTHTGKVAEVLATSSRLVDEDVVTIRTAVGVEYTMTKNHPVWITRRSGMTLLATQVGNWRRHGSKGADHALRLRGLGSRTVWDSRDLDRDFVPAGEVREGDIVWGPDGGPAGVENTLSVGLKRLLGYYLAEGHITHRERSSEIGFSFHRDETAYQDEVEQLLRSEWGITHIRRQYPSTNATQLICYNTRLAHWLEQFAGKGAEGKHIPFGRDDEDWTPLLATYWCGDGTATKKQSLRAKTVSPTLARQLYDLLVRQGLSPRVTKEAAGSVTIMGRAGHRRDSWQISVDGESARRLSEAIDYPLRHENTKDYAPVSARMDGFIGSPVVKITESRHQGYVHNIEVAGDNSYELLGSFGVHNCGIFGFGRIQGRKATGVVRVLLNSAAVQDISLPVGTQFYTRTSLPGTGSPMYFSSTQAVVIPSGSLVTDIAVECTLVGVAGNVPPDSITFVGQAIGSSSVTNLESFTGGIDVETDEELRQRFKDTFLRNIAGTEDWYLGLAYQNKNVSKAACFGPIRKYATQIVVPADGSTLSLSDYVSADVKYAWPGAGHVSVFKNLGQTDEVFYRMYDDFEWTSGANPQIKNVATGQLVAGDVVDVEFEYTTRSSRNNPLAGIANKVDVFVNGVDPYTVTERTAVTSQTLSNSSSNELYVGNFARVGSPGSPSASSRFMRLGSVPIISFPSSLTVGTTNYQQGVHYHLLRGTTLLAGSSVEVAGLEWVSGGAPNGTSLTLNYVYNRTPEILQAVIKTGKQITTDVMVHQASYQYLRIYLSIEFDRGLVISQVTNAIRDRLANFFSGLGYGAWIEISDLTLATHQVLGVDNVNLTTVAEDPINYGIRVYNTSSDTTYAIHDTDFKLTDSQLPIFLDIVIRRKANR